MKRTLAAIALGIALFALHHAAVISGALAPPPGYEPAWTLRNSDVPQYFTWLHAAREETLLRNYHAPWITEPALWQPLMLITARTGLPPVVSYYTFHLLLYLLAAAALLYAAEVFCPGRQRWYALSVAACAIPLRLLGWTMAGLLGLTKWSAAFVGGLIDYGYETADGLFRGGVSNSLTLTTGTCSVLMAMALLARYTETERRVYLMALCGVTFVSSLLHPFEVFVIVAASLVPLLLRRGYVQWLTVGVSGFAGMVPYLLAGARAEWVRDSSETLHSSYHPFWILVNFGIPCFSVAYLLLMRFRMQEPRDTVLKSWFLCVPLLAVTPGVPVPTHLLDGYAYCLGFLFVRRIATDKQLRPLVQRHSRAAHAVLACLVAVTAVSLGAFFAQVWRDGRRAEPQLLVNSVRSLDEARLIDWLRANTRRDTLVLAPADLAPWIATIPRPSFASHDYLSITFARQREEADRFYAAKPGAQQFLARYGVGVVIVPAQSPAAVNLPPGLSPVAFGRWNLYSLPGARMSPYPGLAAITGTTNFSAGHRLLAWLGGWMR
jgi:hypothetical protein